ncbi:MAG: hypothetical protein HQL75_02655 [Magnetococcales bacterium]|nr:hypothetical protein [Magnetococcales bacterium]
MGCSNLPDDLLIVPRLFSRLDPPQGEKNEPRPLSDFFNKHALVILGEPGMGKTTSFIQAAREEENAECLTIRKFCRQNNSTKLEGKTLYLDGLDEQRAGKANDKTVLDAIIERLQDLHCPKFRLSCRTADWSIHLDQKELHNEFPPGIVVIRLEPLSEDQVREIVSNRGLDGQNFLEQARQSGIAEWTTNPQLLNMVLEVVSQGQKWPETRKELFESVCSEFVQEHDYDRAKTNHTDDQLILAAGLLCATILRADLDGVSLKRTNAKKRFPDLTRFPETQLPLVEAARTKLFRHPAQERAAYYHRTMAEYLAARFLVHKMAESLPAERVRRLLSYKNELVPSHLRGCHAWVATLCPEPTISLFLRTDPMGLALYGDTASLSPSRKKDLLDCFFDLAKENPWFRGGYWEGYPLGRMADPLFKDRFEAILSGLQPERSHLIFTILDIMQYGKVFFVSPEILLTFIRNPAIPSHFRSRAASVFLTHCSYRLDDLKPILEGLGDHKNPENDLELRAVLLEALYPAKLTLQEIKRFLVPPRDGTIGSLSLAHDLVKMTPDEQLPTLVDILDDIKCEYELYESESNWHSLAEIALARSLEQHGEHVPVETLYLWLRVGTGRFGIPNIDVQDNQDAIRVKNWLHFHPEKIKSLFLLFLQRTVAKDLGKHTYYFWGMMRSWTVPIWFPEWCLKLATEDQYDSISVTLFRIGISELLRKQPERSYERAFALVEKYPKFEKCLDLYLYCDLYSHGWEFRQKNNSKTKTEKDKLVTDLSNRLPGIRNGSDFGAIFGLSQIYQGWFTGANTKIQPHQRLIEETSSEIAQAAEEGFVQFLTNHSLPTPEEIGKISIENRRYNIALAVLSALDFNLCASDTVWSSAIAFRLSEAYDDDHPAWFNKILTTLPDIAANACKEFWLPQLQAGIDHVNRLFALSSNEMWSGIAQRVAIPLLEECPELKGSHLSHLLIAALMWGDRSALTSLTICRCKMDQTPGWPQWAAVAYILEKCEWSEIKPVLSQNENYASDFFGFIFNVFYPQKVERVKKIPGIVLKIKNAEDLLNFYGKIYPPVEFGKIENDQKFFKSQRIVTLIDEIAEKMSSDATDALQRLIDHKDLSAWGDRLRYALSQHRHKMADESFEALGWKEVINVVTGNVPATASDFHALVVDQIRTIAKELRDKKTDGYKTYWNTEGRHNQPTNPKVEDNSRDRLVDSLQHKLASFPGLRVEPEVRHAGGRRSDIEVQYLDWNIPIEIKQDSNQKLWNAIEDQLISYMQDQKTGVYGIYLVIWYGKRENGPKLPPTPQELENSLRETIPNEYRNSIEVIVLDVSTRSQSPKKGH